MNADHYRQLFEYHFTANRKVWGSCIDKLTDEQFKRMLDYSTGSIRNQAVHLMSVDKRWFCALRGVEVPRFLNPVHLPTREVVRKRWDAIEVDTFPQDYAFFAFGKM